jgi:thiamine pyrophosphokinase
MSYIARLLSWFLQSQGSKADECLPDLIKGDLDSLRDDVRQYYETLGVPVVQDGDQYSTDLGKCVCSLQEKEQSDGVDTPYDLVVLGGLSGRLDHTVHVLAFLHKLRQSGRRIFAVTDDNVGWVLDETSGFGGLISTSNHLVPEEDTVFVETSRPILWVAELRKDNL